MRKIISFILALVVFMSGAVVFADFYDVPADAPFKESVDRLSVYGIIGGFDGYFSPYDNLTRAEFAKIATIVAGLDKEVAGNASAKRFNDVDVWFWGNGYINTAAKNQLITGYPNGSYDPDKNVDFGEAVTIVLRLLGYTTEDLGNNWPFVYVNKARELGLVDNIEQDAFTPINRASAAIIIDRALNTDLKNSTSKLVSKMEFSQTDETIITATKAEDATLKADEIKTTLGTYSVTASVKNIPIMAKVRLVLNKDKKVMDIVTVSTGRNQTVVVDSSYDEGITYTTLDGLRGQIKLEDNSVMYFQGDKTTYSAIKNRISQGSELVIYYTDLGSVDYAMLKNTSWGTPVVVKEDVVSSDITSIEGLSFSSGVKVIKNGYASKLGDIRKHDVVYYATVTNTLYVYSDKISGVYEKAHPSKASVSSITLSGNELSLETQTATYKLGENAGSYKIGSKFTALLGRDGSVVDVVDLNAADVSSIAIILSVSEKVSTEIETQGRKDFYTKVMTGNGNEIEYKSDKNYSDMRGSVMKISFDGEYAKFSPVSKNQISGKIDQNNRKIGDKWLGVDAKVIELYAPSYSDATAQVIEITDIPNVELLKDNVVHAEIANKFGDISLLVVKDITKSEYQVGLLVSSKLNSGQTKYTVDKKDENGDPVTNPDTGETEKDQAIRESFNASGTYEIIVNGVQKTYSTSRSAYSIAVGGILLKANGTTIEEMKALYSIPTSGKCEAIDFERVKIGSSVYKIAPNVQIYRKDYLYTYSQISINDLDDYSMSNIRLYSDGTPASGGLVRVITFDK